LEENEDGDLAHTLHLLDAIGTGQADDEATTSACQEAVLEGLDRYSELLEHGDQEVHEAAAELVAHLSVET
jgi:hypothetical protein